MWICTTSVKERELVESFWSLDLKAFCWLRPSNKNRTGTFEHVSKLEQCFQHTRKRWSFSTHVSLVPQSQTECVSASLSVADGYLASPMQWDHWAHPFLTNQNISFLIKDTQCAYSMFLSKAALKKKEASHSGTSNLAPRVAFVFSKRLRLFLLKKGDECSTEHSVTTFGLFCTDDNDQADYREAGMRGHLLCGYSLQVVMGKPTIKKGICLK